MGRTTLALALATALADRRRRILLVDADFEAPGVSLLIKQIIPAPSVAFADLLALANTDPSAQADEAIEIVAERLRDQEIDGVFVLPSTRELGLPEVLPDSLTFSQNRSAFFVGDLLARLGARLDVDLVLVDLRAGLSELSVAMFLDPRLQHALITTLNGQSIDGTSLLLSRMQEIAAKWRTATAIPLPASLTVIVNQVPADQISPGSFSTSNAALAELDEELRKFVDASKSDVESVENPGTGNPFFDRPIVPTVIAHVPDLNILPRDFYAVRKLLSGNMIQNVMLDKFANLLPPPPTGSLTSLNTDAPQARRQKLEKGPS